MKIKGFTFAACALFGMHCSPAGGDADPAPFAASGSNAASIGAPGTGDWQLPVGAVRTGPTDEPSAFCGNRLPPAAQSVNLVVPVAFQQTGNWCVLGALEMVAEYYGLTVDQCRLADMRVDYPEGTCCASAADATCNRGTALEETMAVLAKLGLYAATGGTPAPEHLRTEIANGRPLIFVEGNESGSHAIVMTGYVPPSPDGTPEQFAVLDPAAGFKLLTYNELRAAYWGPRSVMYNVYYRISPSPDGCNRDFDPGCGCAGGAERSYKDEASVPFGAYDYSAWAGDTAVANAAVDLPLYAGRPEGATWFHADVSAIEAVAKYHGLPSDVQQCTISTMLTGDGGMDCCAPDAPKDPSVGIQADIVTGASPTAYKYTLKETCGQPPTSWRVGRTMGDLGLSGLHVARPLTHVELRNEVVNGRPVIVRAQAGTFGQGAMFVIASWAPIDSGGDRFLVLRQGYQFKWVTYVELTEGREPWITSWSDSWFRVQ